MNNKKWRIVLVSIFIVVVLAVVVCILIVHKSEDKSQNGEGGVTMSDVDVVNTTTEEHIDFTTDDWTSFEFALNNKVYTWPVTYSELTADGYVIKYDEDVDYENSEEFLSRFHTMYHKDNSEIWFSVSFEESTEVKTEAADYYIESMLVNGGKSEVQGDFVLCNGVKTGMSYDQVVAVMGAEVNKDYYDGGSGDRFDVRYENEDGTHMLKMTFEDDELETINLYDLSSQLEEESLKDYSKDWENLVFTLNGKNYTWPISYNQLIEDGYSVVEKSYEEYTDDPLSCTEFMWDEDDRKYTFSVRFRKKSQDAALTDSYVEGLVFYDWGNIPNYRMELGNGIGFDSSYDDVVEKMGKPTTEGLISGGGTTYAYNTTYKSEDGLRMIEFIFDSSYSVYRISIYNLEEVEI